MTTQAILGPHILLLRVLARPEAAADCTPAQWDLLVRQARSAGVLATLAGLIETAGLYEQAPHAAQEALRWAACVAQRQEQAVRYEVEEVASALAALDLPWILLKGAAYLLSGSLAAQGRLFSDIDLLVPRARLAEVEAALMLQGWSTTHLNDYDQRYYRRWMHELPPMQHVRRESTLDIHHGLLPETAAHRPDPALLFAAARPLPGLPGAHILGPADLILHSMIHLLHESEFHHGTRDLFDLHRLLSGVRSDPAFWAQLIARADQLGQLRTLYYATHMLMDAFSWTPPESATRALARAAPAAVLDTLMRACLSRVLLPAHPSCQTPGTPLARAALYLRGHHLRMPPLLLARHLSHKALYASRASREE